MNLNCSILLLLLAPLLSARVAAYTSPKKSEHGHRHHRRAVRPTTTMIASSSQLDDGDGNIFGDNNNDGTISDQTQGHSSRRRALSQLATIFSAGVFTSSSFPSGHRALAADTTAAVAAAAASASTELENVYFGAGCFWHVQHEMIAAERSILQRKDNELTSLTGYAGGTNGKDRGTDKEGRVCYHNFLSVADYGQLGHGEVVGISIPSNTVGQFSEEYFKLFGSKGERADPMDKGGEYR